MSTDSNIKYYVCADNLAIAVQEDSFEAIKVNFLKRWEPRATFTGSIISSQI